MATDDDAYVYDEESGEWMPSSELAERQAEADRVEVRDAVGNLLADGDQVTLVKDLDVKGAGQTLKHSHQVDPVDRRCAGNRLQVPGYKGPRAARRVREEALVLLDHPANDADGTAVQRVRDG